MKLKIKNFKFAETNPYFKILTNMKCQSTQDACKMGPPLNDNKHLNIIIFNFSANYYDHFHIYMYCGLVHLLENTNLNELNNHSNLILYEIL